MAEATLRQVTDRATVIQKSFESGLDEALDLFRREDTPIDVAYVDGHHDEAATIEYGRLIAPQMPDGSLMILDDIHAYVEMWRAWQTVTASPGFAAAINVGRFGLLVRQADNGTAVQYDLSRYTGWWPVGPSRSRSGRW